MMPTSGSDDLSAFAREKLIRVFGESEGRRAYDATLASVKLETIRSPEDLQLFAKELSRKGGMLAAVGGILNVAAVLRGAR